MHANKFGIICAPNTFVLYYIYIYYTVLSVNEYTPLKSKIVNNISMNKNIFQNVDKIKFYITSV